MDLKYVCNRERRVCARIVLLIMNSSVLNEYKILSIRGENLSGQSLLRLTAGCLVPNRFWQRI